VDPGAPVTMTASPDLEIEGAVDFVLLSAEDGSQILGHGERLNVLFTARPETIR